MEVEKLQNHTRKPSKRWEPAVFFFLRTIFFPGWSLQAFHIYYTIPPLSASNSHVMAINSASDPAASFRNALRCKRKEKASGGLFSSWFLFLSRQRTHPGQHHKRSDRHHKWLNSQWLHLEGKGGAGQGRGCLTGLGCQKRSFEAGKRVEGRVKHILQGLHRLCEPLGTSVPWTQRVTLVLAGQTYRWFFSNERPMRNSV